MITIQARSTSERLPGKSLMDLNGKPLIQHVIDQCTLSGSPIMLLVPTGDELVDYCKEKFIPYFEGSEDNVLERFYHCAKTYKLPYVVRVTGDCPLVNPATIASIVGNGSKGLDYLSNCIHPCTSGLEVEFISYRLLEYTYCNAKSVEDREHVTSYIRNNINTLASKPYEFKISELRDTLMPQGNYSVDTKEDLEVVSAHLKAWGELKPVKV